MKKNMIKLLSLMVASSMLMGCSLLNNITGGNKDKESENESSENGTNYGGDSNGSTSQGEGSSNSDSSSQGGNETGSWSSEIQEEMVLYLGEALPFVQLDDATLAHGYSDYYASEGFGLYYMYDDSEVDLLSNYGAALEEAGYEYVQNDDGDFYTKTTSVGDIFVYYQWFEATEEDAAGNGINVLCPLYQEPVSEETLLADGYVKQTGFPREVVDQAMEGTGITFPAVNETGAWYVASELYEGDEGSYYCVYLATEGEYFDTYYESLTDLGMAYDEDWECFYDSTMASDYEIYINENNGWTLFYIFGPTLGGGEGEVSNEVENPDGSIVITFTFESNLVNGTGYDGIVFESVSASLTVNKGNASTAPTYYDNGNTLRFYAKSNMVIEAGGEYVIDSVVLTVGPSNNKKLEATTDRFTPSSGSVSVNDDKDTVTISGVDNALLTIGLAMNDASGNIAFSSVVVTVRPAE